MPAPKFDGTKLRNIFAFIQTLLALFGGLAQQQITFGDYLKWLTWAKNLGANLKPILAWLAEGAELFRKVFPPPVTPPAETGGGLEMLHVDEATAQAEEDVLCMLKE